MGKRKATKVRKRKRSKLSPRSKQRGTEDISQDRKLNPFEPVQRLIGSRGKTRASFEPDAIGAGAFKGRTLGDVRDFVKGAKRKPASKRTMNERMLAEDVKLGRAQGKKRRAKKGK